MKEYKIIINKRVYAPAAEEGHFIDVDLDADGYNWDDVQTLARLLIDHGVSVRIEED